MWPSGPKNKMIINHWVIIYCFIGNSNHNKSVIKTNILIYRFSTRYVKHVTLRCQLRNSLGSVFCPQDHILFSRLWTVPSGLVPRVSCLVASSLSIIINFFCGLCRGLFFYSSCLLQVAMSSSRGSSNPGMELYVSYVFCIGRWILYCWTIGKAC